MANIYQASNIYVFGLFIRDDFYQQDGTRCDYIGKYLHLNFLNNPFVIGHFGKKKVKSLRLLSVIYVFEGIGSDWGLMWFVFFPLVVCAIFCCTWSKALSSSLLWLIRDSENIIAYPLENLKHGWVNNWFLLVELCIWKYCIVYSFANAKDSASLATLTVKNTVFYFSWYFRHQCLLNVLFLGLVESLRKVLHGFRLKNSYFSSR